MARPDAFALPHSSLNPVLFAEIGSELNGTHLTMLSMLARLGYDPWAEAARWVGMPKSAVTASIAGNIARMPLEADALANAPATAARIAGLLPNHLQSARAPLPPAGALSRFLPPSSAQQARILIVIGSAVAFGLLTNLFLTPHPASTGASPGAAPVAQGVPTSE